MSIRYTKIGRYERDREGKTSEIHVYIKYMRITLDIYFFYVHGVVHMYLEYQIHGRSDKRDFLCMLDTCESTWI